jgi:hypothetical protein
MASVTDYKRTAMELIWVPALDKPSNKTAINNYVQTATLEFAINPLLARQLLFSREALALPNPHSGNRKPRLPKNPTPWRVKPVLFTYLFAAISIWFSLAFHDSTRRLVLNKQVRPALEWFAENGTTLLNISAAAAVLLCVVVAFATKQRNS